MIRSPGEGSAGSGNDGWLVGFWRTGKHGYEPLAGLQIARRIGVVLSLRVREP